MLYQNTFQNLEEPAQTHISCYGYHTDKLIHYPLHCHAYYEISYLVSGTRYQVIDGERHEVHAGSMFLIPPLHMHGYENITDCDDLVIQFSSNFLYNICPSLEQSQMLMLGDSKLPYLMLQEGLVELLQQLFDLCFYDNAVNMSNNVSFELKMVSMLLNLLSELLSRKELQITNAPVCHSEITHLTEVINFIITHPEQKLDMQAASHMTGISYYNFSRFFKQATGLGYSEYCNLLRVRYTENLLINSDLSVSEIAALIGIDTQSYFTRLFKTTTGLSPMQYRHKYKPDRRE